MSGADARARRIAVLSSNEIPWGGSEELWFEAALSLADQGCRVTVIKPNLPDDRAARLKQAGCAVRDLARPLRLPRFVFDLAGKYSRYFTILWLLGWTAIALLRSRADLVVLSQGGNWDGFTFGILLKRLKLPYVVISQAASEFDWPPDSLRAHIGNMHRRARRSFFVSNHNRELTEFQIGSRLPNASVVRNPFLVRYDRPLQWPELREPVRLACVARLYPMQKGQDLLLQILARPEWRQRDVQVTFFGEGVNGEGLQGIAKMLGLANVTFAGQVSDVGKIWREHHALILPSRAEGLPLAVVETMLAGRVVIATNAGGTAEVIDDDRSGFVSDSCSLVGLADVMERAWARVDDWPEIGLVAAEQIRRLVPPDPGAVLAGEILSAMPATQGSQERSTDRAWT